MGKNSAIEWTNHTWNPWQGCRKVSAGCKHCYMYREKKRWGQDPGTVVRSKPPTFNKPLSWTESARVFVCSWSDFFIEEADSWRAEAWDIIGRTPHLTYQILTKRPENIADRLPADWGDGWPNVWLGVSAEDQQTANERIPLLLRVKSAVYFASLEPLLGSVNLHSAVWRYWADAFYGNSTTSSIVGLLDWVIVGGESGPDARPMHPNWARSLRDQCREAGVPFFFKQWGRWKKIQIDKRGKGDVLVSPKRGIVEKLPKFEQNPHDYKNIVAMESIGKKATGRFLDGKIWSQFPTEPST